MQNNSGKVWRFVGKAKDTAGLKQSGFGSRSHYRDNDARVCGEGVGM
jgi:hypothetical protein